MTNLKEKIKEELSIAIKARDAVASGTLRMVIAAISTEEVSGKESRALSDQEVMTVLNKEVKKRKESIEAYTTANRKDLADIEDAELNILLKYLPEPLNDSEVTVIVDQAIAEAAAAGQTGMKAMGQVMKSVNTQVIGRADGTFVANLVKQKLSS
jgi:hypothetical protein